MLEGWRSWDVDKLVIPENILVVEEFDILKINGNDDDDGPRTVHLHLLYKVV